MVLNIVKNVSLFIQRKIKVQNVYVFIKNELNSS